MLRLFVRGGITPLSYPKLNYSASMFEAEVLRFHIWSGSAPLISSSVNLLRSPDWLRFGKNCWADEICCVSWKIVAPTRFVAFRKKIVAPTRFVAFRKKLLRFDNNCCASEKIVAPTRFDVLRKKLLRFGKNYCALRICCVLKNIIVLSGFVASWKKLLRKNY